MRAVAASGRSKEPAPGAPASVGSPGRGRAGARGRPAAPARTLVRQERPPRRDPGCRTALAGERFAAAARCRQARGASRPSSRPRGSAEREAGRPLPAAGVDRDRPRTAPRRAARPYPRPLTRLRGLRPDHNTSRPRGQLLALESVANRVTELSREERELKSEIQMLVGGLAPQLFDESGIGPASAAQILLAWSHPRRLRGEAAFARLAGAAPIPASSGQTIRHRLDRGGDRQLNRALHTIIIPRRKNDPATIAYVQRRVAEGKSVREAIRCLKRYLARSSTDSSKRCLRPLDSHRSTPGPIRPSTMLKLIKEGRGALAARHCLPH